MTRLHHLPNNLHQSPILQRSRNSLLITELLIDLVASTVRPLFNPHVYTEPWREGLLQSHSDSEADDGGETAVRDGGGDQDGDCLEGRGGDVGESGFDEDIGEGDDG